MEAFKRPEVSAWLIVEQVRNLFSVVARELEDLDRLLWGFMVMLSVPENAVADPRVAQDPRPVALELESVLRAVRRDHLQEAAAALKRASREMRTPIQDLDLRQES